MKKSNLGTEKSKPSLFDDDKEKNNMISNKIGNLLNKNNLIISLLLILVFHSFYLQFIVFEKIEKHAKEASSTATDAVYYAERAMNEAREAKYNSFGYQCSCPT